MRTLVLVLCFLAAVPALRAESLSVGANDTTQTLLAAQKGKKLTLRLNSGQELSGTLREATAKLVLLEGLAGREFFDAAIPMEAIEAIIVRTRQ